jgi:hypothetical protein
LVKLNLAGATFAGAILAGAILAGAIFAGMNFAGLRRDGLLIVALAATFPNSSFATLAFLVVLRVLIKLFFSMDIV